MKTYLCILSLTLIAISFSCKEIEQTSSEDDINSMVPDSIISENIDEKPKNDPDDPGRIGIELVPNQVVLYFEDAAAKGRVLDKLSELPAPESVRSCPCDLGVLELWEYDDPANVEGAIGRVSGNNGTAGGEGENQFIFSLPDADNYSVIGRESSILSKLVIQRNSSIPPPNTINIAIIDSGLDSYRLKDENEPFLYDTQGLVGCSANEFSGWDFLEDDEDVKADHEHGPFVTELMTSTLEESDIPFSILPLKVFDKYGKATYFDIVCAFAYINKVQSQRNDIHFVNASFGYHLNNEDQVPLDTLKQRQDILRILIKELESSAVVVTSSGNEGDDNNLPENIHYPSEFNTTDISLGETNIVGVGGFEGIDITMNPAGNFGTNSIDLAAFFGHYDIEFRYFDTNGDLISDGRGLLGTSYGTAFNTAKMAEYLWSQSTTPGQIPKKFPSVLKDEFFNSNLVDMNNRIDSNVKDGKYVKN